MHARVVAVVVVLLGLSLPAMGAQSFVGGYSGNILTPDAVVAPLGTWEASFHDFVEILGDEDLISFGVIYGIAPNFEIGASFLNNDENDVVFSGKYELVTETAARPAVLVGVFDAFGMAEWLSDDASFYLAVSKNVTPIASDIADEPSKPLRLTAGFGSGVFDGFFAGLDWTLTPQFSLMAEYLNEGIGADSQVDAGIRYAVSNSIRLDAASIDFEDFAFGVTFTTRYQ